MTNRPWSARVGQFVPFVLSNDGPRVISPEKKSSTSWAPIKPGFHMSGKSQTVWDFTVSRPPQIQSNENSNRNRRYPRSSGMNGDKSGESGAFLFSRRVPSSCAS